jgi:hypothetical protein
MIERGDMTMPCQTYKLTRYTVKRHDGGAFYFLKENGSEYGFLLTETSAADFNKVWDIFERSSQFDEATHQFYQRIAKQYQPIMRPLN